MNQLRIKNKNEYVIEVNDNGDTISFNLEDPELMLKFDNALRKIKRIQNNLKADELVLRKQEDKKTDGYLSQNKRKEIELAVKAFKDMRLAMDDFLGEGACQKIFGNSNYATMYDELFEQLQPHFENMKLNAETFKEEIINKYSEDEEDAI